MECWLWYFVDNGSLHLHYITLLGSYTSMSTINCWIHCKEAVSHSVTGPCSLYILLVKVVQQCDTAPTKKAGSENELETPQYRCVNHIKTCHGKRLSCILLIQTFGFWTLHKLEPCDGRIDVLAIQYLFLTLKLTVFKYTAVPRLCKTSV